MSLYVAVKDPAAFGLWNPGRRHRAPDRHPLRDRHPAVFRRVNIVASAVACAVYTEVGAMHVHGMGSVRCVDPTPANFLANSVRKLFIVGPRLAIDREDYASQRVADRVRRSPFSDDEHTIVLITVGGVHDQSSGEQAVCPFTCLQRLSGGAGPVVVRSRSIEPEP